MSVVIVSTGARTSIGLDAPSTAFMLRLGAASMAEAPLVDGAGEPITFCLQPTLDPLLVGEARAAELAVAAFDEAIAPFADLAKAGFRVGLCLCLDEPSDPTAPAPSTRTAPGTELIARLRARLPHLPTELSARGAAGAAAILPKAVDALHAGHLDAVVLGGAHTDYEPSRIAQLVAEGRLYSSENLDALIPGEAAAFVVLMDERRARQLGAAPIATIESFATAWEQATPWNDKSAYQAKGLTSAIRDAASALLDHDVRVGWLQTDLTFEMRRLHEMQAMFTRTHKLWTEPYQLENHAHRIGHLGAAAIPLFMALAAEGWKRGYAYDDRCVVYGAADAGDRGAVVLAKPPA